MTLRDWRAGELRFLLAALTLAVTALSTVNFFSDRMHAGLERDAHQMLAADLVLASDAPLDQAWRAEAQRRGLRLADTVAMFSMAVAGQGDDAVSALVALKSVSAAYPLRGRLRVQLPGAEAVSDAPPAPGTVWIDAALLDRLRVRVGSALRIGDKTLTVAQVIAAEPDVVTAFMSLAPRVLMAETDLPATGLLQSHAIATYRMLLAGAPEQVAGYERWARARLAATPAASVELSSMASNRGEAREMLDQTQQFLSLVSLLSALLAALAVALAARRYALRHLDACAMLRCLGSTQRQLAGLHALEFLLLGLLAGAAGVALGYAGHFALVGWLGKLAPADLPPPGWTPALQGLASGLVLLLGFAMPPVLQLRDAPPLRLLRRAVAAPQAGALAGYALGMVLFTGLLMWQTGDVIMGLVAALALLVCGAGYALMAWLGLLLLGRLRGAIDRPAWRFAVTDLRRRPGATITQIVALALGLTALLLLTVVRAGLLASWEQATPPGAPNHYVINIQPDQRGDIAEWLHHYGQPVMQALTRARLVGINGRAALAAISAREGEPDRRARELLEREIDIGHAGALPSADTLSAGSWYGAADGSRAAGVAGMAGVAGVAGKAARPSAAAQGGGAADAVAGISVEEKTAALLRLKLGDRLSFDVAGQPLEARVTSLRKVNWRARQVSLMLLMHPVALNGLPATWAAAVHVPPQDRSFAHHLSRDFPNLTVIDIVAVIRQLERMLAQAVAAVRFLFAFTLAAGVLVLYAALAASQDARTRQSALLRALGATRRQLSRAQWTEHVLTGTLAGLLAAIGASIGNWALARFSFHLDWHWSPLLPAVGVLAGAACALLGGWLGLRNVLNQPPLLSLKST